MFGHAYVGGLSSEKKSPSRSNKKNMVKPKKFFWQSNIKFRQMAPPSKPYTINVKNIVENKGVQEPEYSWSW